MDKEILEPSQEAIKYRFDEEQLLAQLKAYIDATYTAHYSAGNDDELQTFQLIVKKPIRGLFFAIGSILKYGDRFGEKEGMNEKDLWKVVHFGLLAIFALNKLKKQK